MEAIGRIYCPIAWLPLGHDPDAGGGVATAARHGGLFGLGAFRIDDATSALRRRIATSAHTITAHPDGHGGPSWPQGCIGTASYSGHGGHSGSGWHTHILALLSQRNNKGRLPASGMDASHPESHVDADSVRSVFTLSWGNISTHSHTSTMDIGLSCLRIRSRGI